MNNVESSPTDQRHVIVRKAHKTQFIVDIDGNHFTHFGTQELLKAGSFTMYANY